MSAHLSSEPQRNLRNSRPFLKWVGGKQQLLHEIDANLPESFCRYIEPFVGGGAAFFHLYNTNRLVGQTSLLDHNEELINAYRVVRDEVQALIDLLAVHERNHSKEYYYQTRNLDRQSIVLNEVERAARTIYLNRTCYNGLYRVNSHKQFNVPVGSYVNPRVLFQDALHAASTALKGVELKVGDFRQVTGMAKPGDFFYFDPPYDPVSKTSSFTGYTEGNFTTRDQENLADVFKHLTRIGCRCMLSNSHTPLILDLYHDFTIRIVQARRAVNSNGNGRGHVSEVLVLNY